MIIFYHDDNDGKASANLIKSQLCIKDSDSNKIISRIDKSETRFIETDYTKRFLLEDINEHEYVYIVDFSIDPKDMDKLLKITKNVVWIDHHKTSIDKYSDYNETIYGSRVIGMSGCALTYLYLYHLIQTLPDINIVFEYEAPKYLKLINDWDVWNMKYGNDTKYFKLSTDSLDLHPLSEEWDKLQDDSYVDELIECGKLISNYVYNQDKTHLDKYGFETDFEGYKCLALNTTRFSSESFKSCTDDYDIFIPFCFNGELYKFSLYSKGDLDVSKIASKYGGGGHKNAAGFQTDIIPFKKKSEVI